MKLGKQFEKKRVLLQPHFYNMLENTEQEEKKTQKTWKRRFIMYVVVLAIALVYIFAFSDSNYRKHRKLDTKIKEYETEISKQQKNLEGQRTFEDIQSNPQLMERYRREVLNMKKPDEDLFIIEK